MEENKMLQEDNFSFRNIINLLKNSIKRLIIYAIIFAIVGLGVAGIIVAVTKENTEYKGIIEYNYKNIDEGLDPKGNVLNVNLIKSTVMINSVLASMGEMDSQEIARLTPILAEDIIIKGHISESTRKEIESNSKFSYTPSRYEVIIKSNKKTKFSKNEYLDFLNKLITSYVKYFSDKYDFGKFVPQAVKENIVEDAVDYIDAIKVYQNEISNLQAEIKSLSNDFNAIKSKLQSRSSLLLTQVDELNSYILKKNVQKTGAVISLEDYLENEISMYGEQKIQFEHRAKSLAIIIENYNIPFKNISQSENVVVTVADTSGYDMLINEYNSVVAQEAYYTTKETEAERTKGILGTGTTNPEDRTAVEKKFKLLYGSYLAELDIVNTELNNYSELNLMNRGINVVMSAVKMSNMSYFGAVVAFVIILAIGIAAAIATTHVKTQKLEQETKTVSEKTN